ncbi:hypothetical protein KAI87_14345, partial [Myxococcota bacterium]|nr:hypothetical protein [Myxococcota bacterium]
EEGMEASSKIETKFVYYQGMTRTGDKRSVVTLSTDSKPFEADVVDAIGNGHLAWMIPVGVLTFPIGLAIGSAVLNSVEGGIIERNTAKAIDQAAEQLAEHLARKAAFLGPNQEFRVAIVLLP